MNTYRFILEKYRGISTRYTCPQCGRKHTFTRYIDTENNNRYISERVGKCEYYHTPREYFTDNPHKRDKYLVEDGSLRPCGYHYTPREYFTDNPWLRDGECVPFFQNIGKWKNGTRNKPSSRPICVLHYRYLSPVVYLISSIKLLMFCSSFEGHISNTSGVSTTM